MQIVQVLEVVQVRYVQVAIAVVGVDESNCGDEEVISTAGVVAANRGHMTELVWQQLQPSIHRTTTDGTGAKLYMTSTGCITLFGCCLLNTPSICISMPDISFVWPR